MGIKRENPLNSLASDKILDQFKLKAFTDDKIKCDLKWKFVSERIENILGKGENAGYQHFLLFPKCFQKPLSLGSFNVGNLWYRTEWTSVLIR